MVATLNIGSTTSKGSTDVIGYAMIFGIILVVATTASTVGFDQINSQYNIEQISTVEQGFEILDKDIQTIQQHKDPKKQTPLNIQSGSIGYGETTTIKIGERSGDSITTDNTSVETTQILYQKSQTDIVYGGGVIFNDDDNGGITTTGKTGITITSETALVPAVVVNPTSPTKGISPSGVIIIESTHISNTQTVDDRTVTTSGDPLWIQVQSTQAKGWESQFNEEGFADVSRNGDTVFAKLSKNGNTPTEATLSTTIINTELKD